jgi:predicted KAP-like P-loop ATPase
MYLLVFDRELAEKAVKERYPSEGPHFLEKIIQASFELPLPPRDDLNSAALSQIERMCGQPNDPDQLRRFMNIFYDAISPYLSTPRDLTRLTNAMTVSWPAVEREVNLADYVALEVMRLFESALYNTLRANKDRVTGVRSDLGGKEDTEQKLQEFLICVPENRREQARVALMRLFPRFENVGYSSDFKKQWEAERLVCTEKHFDTYFRMAIGDETLSIDEIDTLIERCNDGDYVKQAFRGAHSAIRKNGKSKVPLLLDEINVHAGKIEKDKFQTLISAIFQIADEIDRQEDRERGVFYSGDNYLRIHWLVRKLTFERCDLDERSKILITACQGAALGWLVDFTRSAWTDHYPREGKEPEPPEKCLINKGDLEELKSHAIRSIEAAAASGELIAHEQLSNILFRWREFAEDGNAVVKAWVNDQLVNDVAIALLAKAFTGESWSQSMGIAGLGDRVSMRQIRAYVDDLDTIMDVGAFRKRLEELVSSDALEGPHREYVKVFLDDWVKHESGSDRRN